MSSSNEQITAGALVEWLEDPKRMDTHPDFAGDRLRDHPRAGQWVVLDFWTLRLVTSYQHKFLLPAAASMAELMPTLKAHGWTVSQKAARFQLETVDLRITPDGELHVFPITSNGGKWFVKGTADNYAARGRDLQREGALRTYLDGVKQRAARTGEGVSNEQQ